MLNRTMLGCFSSIPWMQSAYSVDETSNYPTCMLCICTQHEQLPAVKDSQRLPHDAPFSHLNCWNCKPKYLRISLQKWYKHEASPLHEHGPVASWVGGALRIAPRVTTSGETFKSWLQHGSCQPMSTNVNNEPKTESDWIYSVFGSCHFDSPEHICPETPGIKRNAAWASQ